MSAPHLRSPRVSPVLAASVRPAAGAAHSAEAPPDSRTRTRSRFRRRRNERQCLLGGPDARLVGRGMPRRDDLDDAGAHAGERRGRTVRGRGEAGNAVEGAALAIVRLRRHGHGGRSLARADDIEPPPVGRGRKMGRKANLGVRRGDGCVIERQQLGPYGRRSLPCGHGMRTRLLACRSTIRAFAGSCAQASSCALQCTVVCDMVLTITTPATISVKPTMAGRSGTCWNRIAPTATIRAMPAPAQMA